MKKNNSINLIDKNSAIGFIDGIKKAKDFSSEVKRNFNESIDIALVLGIDPKQSDQSVRGSVILPNGSGKKVRIVVFTSSEEDKKVANDLGVDMVGLDDIILKIEDGFLDFDCCIATPDSMQKISKVAKKLGPRGLMPSPKNGTVTTNIKSAILDSLKGRVDFKNDKGGILQCSFGKIDFELDALVENLKSIIKAVKALKPESSKGNFIKRAYISSTMGTCIEVKLEGI
jgi:large subunit ribosomal protein L1